MKIFEKLQEAGILSEDDARDLENTITKQLDEAKRSHLDQVRAEYVARMSQDRANLVEAIDAKLSMEMTNVITEKVSELNEQIELKNAEIIKLREQHDSYEAAKDSYLSAIVSLKQSQSAKLAEAISEAVQFVETALTQEMTEFAIDKAAVVEAKQRYTEAVETVQSQFRTELREQVSKLRRFVIENLEVETDKLQTEQSCLIEQREHMAVEFNKMKENESLVLEAKAESIDRFITESLYKEIAEFQEDKQALVEARVKFASEANQKLKETQDNFLRQATAEVDAKVTSVLLHELTTLKEDIQRARENEFGRKIFEVLAEEVKANFINTNDEVKKLQESIASIQAEKRESEIALVEAHKQIQVANSRVKLIQESSKRDQKMEKLLSPLTGDKRRVMRDLLSSVKTERLDEAFDKYIDNVITTSKTGGKPRSKLIETTTEQPTVEQSIVVTGDRTTVTESVAQVAEEPQVIKAPVDEDLTKLIHLTSGRKHNR